MCVCFPAVKLLLNAKFPKYFGSTHGPVGARGSLHLSGGEATESRSSSFLRIVRSKISIMLGQSQISSSSDPRSTPWVDEENTPVTEVVSIPDIEDRHQANSIVDIEMHDVHEKGMAL